MEEPPPIRLALARRDAALAEVRRWENFVQMWRELQGEPVDNANGGVGAAPSDLFKVRESSQRNLQPAARRSSVRGDETNDIAAAIVAERGSMGTRQLLPLMAERGHEITGKDPYNVLHTRLSRGKRLVFDKIVGWKLHEQPRHTDEAAGPTLTGEPAASVETPNDAERRGEVDLEIGP